ncbi:plasmid partitioning protein RepB C-terminal domain-containing protein [Piscinibacter defluvii]|uniref:plasmid partitioning protein RepB C-terminal domain-containing protein n=1 Tax=Piscinibacter defluvii TaxID=1796922 RepID=UPI000FDD560C|nr:plasmid partitioning protein RepB C-terminal domain-containing protein [Piscinibacter defluvii]
MSDVQQRGEVRMIALDSIDVLNPRERNDKLFDEIVVNIKRVGLKKPITVTPRADGSGGERYLLVCGEGRMKAFKALGEAHIPALVVNVSDEDAFIMSLAENIARRQCRPLELLSGIEQLRDKGYKPKEVAAKTGLTPTYVQGILTLLEHGEQRLIVAVERGEIPLNAAIAIVGAGDDDKAVQAALQEAYESGTLRGKNLLDARKVIDRRKTLGKSIAHGTPRKREQVTSTSLVRTYQKEVERQKLIVKKAEFTQHRLLFVVSALKQLLTDEHFATLLRAEGLDSLPKQLAERVWAGGHPA